MEDISSSLLPEMARFPQTFRVLGTAITLLHGVADIGATSIFR
jgi:hypothetical protein